MEIEITKKDLEKIVHWILCKFREDSFHQQMPSSRRDLLGGFIDRWINRAPEFLLFEMLLDGKPYKAAIDTFIYGQDTKKNAPDVIGLEKDGVAIAKFAEFEDGSWKHRDGMPFIEVKTFREDQKLVTVPATQFKRSHYYVVVKSHIRGDYLAGLLEDSIFDSKIRELLKGNPDFILSDKTGQIRELPELEKPRHFGSIELVGIYTGYELEKVSIVAEQGENVMYLDEIKPLTRGGHIDEGSEIEEGLFTGGALVPFHVKKLSNSSSITIIKRHKSSLWVNVSGKVEVNGSAVEDGKYILKLKEFDRTSSKKEYISHIDTLKAFAKDATRELIERFDEIAKSRGA